MADKKSSGRVDWEDVRVLIELARQGSLSATAREMGVTHVTVSRRIGRLERDLGQPLFVRETGRYVLTEAGKRILELAGPMSDCAHAMIRAAAGSQDELSGPVRITATEAVGTYIVMPGLKALRERYPKLDIDLRITQQNLSLVRNDADIAIRLAKPDVAASAGIYAVKIAELAYHLYGARTYVDGRRPELFEYIGYSVEFAHWPEAKTLDKLARGGRTAVRINHLGNRIEAARLGLGLALVPRAMADPWPELVRVSRGAPVMRREIYLLVHEDLKDVPRIKAAVDVLTETIGYGYATPA